VGLKNFELDREKRADSANVVDKFVGRFENCGTTLIDRLDRGLDADGEDGENIGGKPSDDGRTSRVRSS
jgi:hypothetical protein